MSNNKVIKQEKDLLQNDNLFNNSYEIIMNLFSLISKKLDNIKQNKDQNYNSKFSKNFDDLKKQQIELINSNNQEMNDLNYFFIIKLINSQTVLFNFLGEVFLEKYLNIKDNDTYNIIKIIINNIISNYDILSNITYKLIDNLEELDDEIKNLNLKLNKKDKYIKQYMDKNLFLKEQLNKNQQENKIISKKLYNNKLNNQLNDNYNKKSMYSKNMIKINQLTIDYPKHNKNRNYSGNKILQQKNISNDLNNKNINITNLFLAGNRIFTVKMMKDIINNIYNSKNNFNIKCNENKQPKETMEEYMYTYFNYKYGLKNMVIEWATNIINGIKNYSEIDSEICLFGKIMRNDLDESCQYIMPKIKKKFKESLVKILKKEFEFKNDDQINEYINKLIKNRISLPNVQLIMNYLYTQEEQKKIIERIKENIDEFKYNFINNENKNKNNILYDLNDINDNNNNSRHNKLTRNEINQKMQQKENESNGINYNELLNIFHEFEVNKREKYLKPFVDIFRSVDEDNDGILNETQFINLVKKMNIFDENNFDFSLNELLNLIDPYENKKIIFTDCVELFSQTDKNNKIFLDLINSQKNDNINEDKKDFNNNNISEEKNSRNSGKEKE